MAQLTGVITTDSDGDTAIYYEGARYAVTEQDAESGDIVRSRCNGVRHFPFGAFYLVFGGSYTNVTDEDGDNYSRISGDDDFTVFRRVEEPAATPLTTAQLVKQKRAELTELEAMLAEETTAKRPVVGDYAIVMEDVGDNFGEGTVVRVIKDDGSSTPFKTVPALLGVETDAYVWYEEDAVQRLTSAEAKSALLAQIEELFA